LQSCLVFLAPKPGESLQVWAVFLLAILFATVSYLRLHSEAVYWYGTLSLFLILLVFFAAIHHFYEKILSKPYGIENEKLGLTVLIFVTEEQYFFSHRLSLAKELVAQGHTVYACTPNSSSSGEFAKYNIKHIPIPFSRNSMSIFSELRSVVEIIRVLKSIQPDIAHFVAIKPSVDGMLASLFCRGPRIVCTIAGLGYGFLAPGIRGMMFKAVLKTAFRLGLSRKNLRIVCQNSDDFQWFSDCYGKRRRQISLIMGSGVDTDEFVPTVARHTKDHIQVVFPARMLWDKGLREYIAAAKLVRARHGNIKFLLVGDIDPKNRASATIEVLQGLIADGSAKWIGYHTDMVNLLQETDIVAMPSYREGLPKSLLEAAACGVSVVTSDAPGCREVVLDKKTGFIVPVKDAKILADRIESLALNSDLRQQFGIAARKLVCENFSTKLINQQYIELYVAMLAP
jgi:glycosyltransferase involved in cell wall biosynthesis